jgi:molybdate transport system ATP-binding protein
MTRDAAPRLLAVELDCVTLRYGRRHALRDISFRVERGERWLLVGANGAGKTALLKLLRGHVWPTPDGRGRRRYVLDDGTHEQPLAALDRIAYLGPERQDKYERYGWDLRVAEVVGTGLAGTDLPLQSPTVAQRQRIASALADVGLRGLARRRFLALSYGQRRRVLLARALVPRPDLLLLDEPLNGLDRRSRAMFLRALRRAASPRAAWVLSTHRAADRVVGATHAARIEQGRLVSQGPVGRGLSARLPSSVRGPGVAIWARRASRMSRAVERTSQPMLALRDVSVYRDYRAVITGLTVEMLAGEHWALLGGNASGKSTLMAMLYGDLAPALGGQIERAGFARGRPIEEWKAAVGFVSPELQATYAATGCSLTEIAISGLHSSIGLAMPATAAERRRARRTLAALGVARLGERRAREVSYGELRRALIARALIQPRRLMLLDEPFDGLDGAGRALVQRLVAAAVRRGMQLIIATHHEEDLPPYIDRVLRLVPGSRPVIGGRE